MDLHPGVPRMLLPWRTRFRLPAELEACTPLAGDRETLAIAGPVVFPDQSLLVSALCMNASTGALESSLHLFALSVDAPNAAEGSQIWATSISVASWWGKTDTALDRIEPPVLMRDPSDEGFAFVFAGGPQGDAHALRINVSSGVAVSEWNLREVFLGSPGPLAQVLQEDPAARVTLSAPPLASTSSGNLVIPLSVKQTAWIAALQFENGQLTAQWAVAIPGVIRGQLAPAMNGNSTVLVVSTDEGILGLA